MPTVEKKRLIKADFWKRVSDTYNKCNPRKIGPGYACSIYTGCHPGASEQVRSKMKAAVRHVVASMRREGYDFSII